MKISKHLLSLVFTGLILMSFIVCFDISEVYAKDKIIIVIDPGHGGPGDEDESDWGAVYSEINMKEKDIDLITATAMYNELSQYNNCEVYLTRTTDEKLSLKRRVEIAKEHKADILISCHYNASEHKRYYGAEIFTSAYDEYYTAGHSLAEYIMDNWEANGKYNKGIKTRLGKNGDYYGIIRIARENNIPAIILEHCYLDNPTDYEVYGNQNAFIQNGIDDATAIADFYGLSKNEISDHVSGRITVEAPPDGVSKPDTTAPFDMNVTINEYDYSTGEITYTVSAKEYDSYLYLYGMCREEELPNEDVAFTDLDIWDYEAAAESMSGTYYVEPGYEGNVCVRVYNNYEQYCDSPILNVMEAEYVSNVPTPTPIATEEPAAEPDDEHRVRTDDNNNLLKLFGKHSDKDGVTTGDMKSKETQGSGNPGALMTGEADNTALEISILVAIIAIALISIIFALIAIAKINRKRRRRKRRKRKSFKVNARK